MHRDIIVMGASAGGVEALSAAVSSLPEDLDGAVFVVLHMTATATSFLPAVLQRYTSLRATTPADGDLIQMGHIYVAPPDHHMLLRRGSVHLSRGPKENGHRPAVDTLFRSAARTHGPRVIGVVLSGTLDDGATGLRMIAARGGVAVVQDPADAAFPGMPLNALAAVPEAIQAPARDVGGIVAETSRSPVQLEGLNAMGDDTSLAGEERNADNPQPSVFTCPECHGTLFLSEEGDFTGFRCRVGHRFSAESLLAGESEALEAALWTALRSLEERNDLLRRMSERARRQGQHNAADRFEKRVRDGDQNAALIRQVLLSGETSRTESA